jgi:hypothetical protein
MPALGVQSSPPPPSLPDPELPDPELPEPELPDPELSSDPFPEGSDPDPDPSPEPPGEDDTDPRHEGSLRCSASAHRPLPPDGEPDPEGLSEPPPALPSSPLCLGRGCGLEDGRTGSGTESAEANTLETMSHPATVSATGRSTAAIVRSTVLERLMTMTLPFRSPSGTKKEVKER